MTAQFPGSVAVSGLRVYDWAASDGLHGGTPHVHTVSSEAYVVTAGTGEVHTLSGDGVAHDALAAGSVLWFTPGTIHRLVNHGDLEIITIMQNAGLPEAGDAVLTFPTEVLRDPERYRAVVTLPSGDEAVRAEAARARRDLALVGYAQLLADVEARGSAALAEFLALAAALVRPRVAGWVELWESTVLASAERTREQLARLAAGDPSHLLESIVVRGMPRPEPRAFGMCGRLLVWDAARAGTPHPGLSR